MKAVFIRKARDIKELEEITKRYSGKCNIGQEYKVTRDVILELKAFEKFTDDLLEDQPWITKQNGGMNKDGEILCIRVINRETGQRILVNSEGYDYPRYTAIEK